MYYQQVGLHLHEELSATSDTFKYGMFSSENKVSSTTYIIFIKIVFSYFKIHQISTVFKWLKKLLVIQMFLKVNYKMKSCSWSTWKILRKIQFILNILNIFFKINLSLLSSIFISIL